MKTTNLHTSAAPDAATESLRCGSAIVYGLNFHPELTGVGRYTGEIAKLMASQGGFEVCVVTAPPYYPAWKVTDGYSNSYSVEKSDNLHIYRAPLYVPRVASRLRRLIHLLSFAFSSAPVLIYSALRMRPDIVIVIMPTFLCSGMGLLAAKLVGARSLIHIQDLELDAFFSLGDGPPGFIWRTVAKIECLLLRRFNQVTTISRTMQDKIVSKGVSREKVQLFRNWVDISAFNPNVLQKHNAIIERIKSECKIPFESRIVLYSGNLGEKQGLELILDAAEVLINQTDISFLIVGNGARRDVLMQDADERNLRNVFFHSLVAEVELPELLAAADLHLVLQKKGMAELVMPSKLNAILSVGGRCLVLAERHSELATIAEEYPGVFSFVALEDDVSLADAIEIEIDASCRRESAHANDSEPTAVSNPVARQFAVEWLDRDVIIPRFFELLRGMRI